MANIYTIMGLLHLLLIVFVIFILVLGVQFVLGENSRRFENVTKLGGFEGEDYLLEHYKTLKRRYENYNEKLGDKFIVQLHYTNWCPHCKEIVPVWKKLKEDKKLAEHAVFFEQDQDECNSPGIKTVPTIIAFKDGVIYKYMGRRNVPSITDWIMELAGAKK